MHAPTDAQVRAALVNISDDERRLLTLPVGFFLVEWDYRDFYAWRDPAGSRRGYVIVERGGELMGVGMHVAGPGRMRAGMCNICRTMQPGTQVSMFTARRAGEAGQRGDSIGTYMCDDLSCHDNVRLAHPLAPSEVRAPGQADLRLDGTSRRMGDFVASVLDPVHGH